MAHLLETCLEQLTVNQEFPTPGERYSFFELQKSGHHKIHDFTVFGAVYLLVYMYCVLLPCDFGTEYRQYKVFN